MFSKKDECKSLLKNVDNKILAKYKKKYYLANIIDYMDNTNFIKIKYIKSKYIKIIEKTDIKYDLYTPY